MPFHKIIHKMTSSNNIETRENFTVASANLIYDHVTKNISTWLFGYII